MYICRVPHKFRMKEIAHILPNWSTRAILLLDRILQGLAGLEHRGLGGGNLDRLLRLGIAPSAGGPRLYLEISEANQLDLVTGLEGLLHCLP